MIEFENFKRLFLDFDLSEIGVIGMVSRILDVYYFLIPSNSKLSNLRNKVSSASCAACS